MERKQISREFPLLHFSKKKTLLITLILLFVNLFSQKTDTSKITFDGHTIYDISNPENKKLILFLHGGVNNPYFKQSPDQISLNYLLENNTSFVSQAIENNFNLIVPISDSSFNWLDKPENAFRILEEYLKTKEYFPEEIYLMGFSDGGTGSYKIFYKHSNFFNGLFVFNGYPQHSNHYKTVDYSLITDKTIAFWGTLNDKTIPYEFLMTEYCQQKKYNPNTYLFLTEGVHGFKSYLEKDIAELFKILTKKTTNSSNEIIHGFVKNDSLQVFYPFRKKITKQYHFGQETYEENRLQLKKYRK